MNKWPGRGEEQKLSKETIAITIITSTNEQTKTKNNKWYFLM